MVKKLGLNFEESIQLVQPSIPTEMVSNRFRIQESNNKSKFINAY